MQSFTDIGLSSSTIEKLKKQGIKQPTPIQAKVIPPLLKGVDLIAQAQTGTGKTFAFVLPILEKMDTDANHVQTLILTPTRELAIQITAEIMKMKQETVKVLAVYGGQDVDKQLKVLQNDVSIVVATPGRLIDHIKRGTIDLSKISYFVLD
ncbi:MAG: DEAD/DEAH box helicase, partial [Niallia sp.]